jgi:hypothetical protein
MSRDEYSAMPSLAPRMDLRNYVWCSPGQGGHTGPTVVADLFLRVMAPFARGTFATSFDGTRPFAFAPEVGHDGVQDLGHSDATSGEGMQPTTPGASAVRRISCPQQHQQGHVRREAEFRCPLLSRSRYSSQPAQPLLNACHAWHATRSLAVGDGHQSAPHHSAHGRKPRLIPHPASVGILSQPSKPRREP